MTACDDTGRGPAARRRCAAARSRVKIRRFNPEIDAEPHWETYEVAALPTDRVLNLLHTSSGTSTAR